MPGPQSLAPLCCSSSPKSEKVHGENYWAWFSLDGKSMGYGWCLCKICFLIHNLSITGSPQTLLPGKREQAGSPAGLHLSTTRNSHLCLHWLFFFSWFRQHMGESRDCHVKTRSCEASSLSHPHCFLLPSGFDTPSQSVNWQSRDHKEVPSLNFNLGLALRLELKFALSGLLVLIKQMPKKCGQHEGEWDKGKS